MTKDEALRLALEALEIDLVFLRNVKPFKGQEDLASDCVAMTEETITAIKAALEAKDNPEKCTPNCEALLQKIVTQRKPLFDEDTQRALDIYENALQPVIDESAAKRIATALGWEPKREWVGLTDDEKESLSYKAEGNTWAAIELAEAKLKEKNT